MKTFSQFVSTRKDQELVETILRLGLDSEMVFETAYHVIKSHTRRGAVNEAALTSDLTEGWWTGLKGAVGGAVNGLLGRPAASIAARAVRAGRSAINTVKQGYNAVAQPAKIKSAQEDLEKFKQRLQGLGLLGAGMPHDAELTNSLGTVGNILQQALADLDGQIQQNKPDFKGPALPAQPNAMDAIRNAGGAPAPAPAGAPAA